MLCTHCNKQEADHHLFVQIGLKVNEVHLCAACAAQLYHQYQSYLGGWQIIADPFWTAAPLGSWPAPAKQTPDTPDKIDEQFQHRRHLTQLRVKLQEAVSSEDYETAARLRDEINREKKWAQSQAV